MIQSDLCCRDDMWHFVEVCEAGTLNYKPYTLRVKISRNAFGARGVCDFWNGTQWSEVICRTTGLKCNEADYGSEGANRVACTEDAKTLREMAIKVLEGEIK